MPVESIKLLHIEDDPGDVALVHESLADSEILLFDLKHAASLKTGINLLTQQATHLVLLDLNLPDSQGIDTLKNVRSIAPDIPVIVMTGLDDESFGIKLLKMGAQDYLVKQNIDRQALHRAIRYAIERQMLINALERERQKKREREEVLFIERLKGQSSTDMTAKFFGMGPLRETLPEVFDELVMRYGLLLDNALEKRTYKGGYDISDKLRELGDDLGLLKSLPRDMVELHTSALSKKHGESTPQKFKVYAEEGRFMLLEIMGYLAIYYRRYAIGR